MKLVKNETNTDMFNIQLGVMSHSNYKMIDISMTRMEYNFFITQCKSKLINHKEHISNYLKLISDESIHMWDASVTSEDDEMFLLWHKLVKGMTLRALFHNKGLSCLDANTNQTVLVLVTDDFAEVFVENAFFSPQILCDNRTEILDCMNENYDKAKKMLDSYRIMSIAA